MFPSGHIAEGSSANMPRWNLRRRSQKIEEMEIIFPQLLRYIPLCYISIYIILVLYYDFSFLLLILIKLL